MALLDETPGPSPSVLAPRRPGGAVPRLRRWADYLAIALAIFTALAILGFYATRLSMPLPIFGADEGSYLIRALFDPTSIARNPLVANVTNGALFSVIRAGAALGGDYVVTDRWLNAAAYLAGLLLLARVATAGLPWRIQLGLLILTVGFPYYRFAFSDMAEGLFVGVLGAMCAATLLLYRRKPVMHALAFGVLAAVLVLVKPNGVAVVLAFAAVVLLDAVVGRDWRAAALRLALFGLAFFTVGNLIQAAAGEPVRNAAQFFVSPFYGSALGAALPNHPAPLAGLNLMATSSAAAVLAGIPAVIALSDLAQRWRGARGSGGFRLANADVVSLILLAALTATLVMVTIFALKVASSPTETKRLWGRYFEFFAPLLWLSAAPAIARLDGAPGRWTRIACAGALALGLAGLLMSFRAGVVLFPWDATATTAFFAPDLSRGTISPTLPLRAISVAVTLIAAGAILWRAHPLRVGVGLILALAVLSTWLDRAWTGPIVVMRTQLDHDMRAIAPTLPARPGATIMVADDPNEALLGFMALQGRPRVLLTTPQATPPEALRAAEMVIVGGPEILPGDQWVRTYRGARASAFRRATPLPAAGP